MNNIQQAIQDLQAGKQIIIVDDKERENEGDLMIAAEKATEEKLNFIIQEAKGLMCIPITSKRCKELQIPDMVSTPNDHFQTPFTVSVDAKNTTTGMSVRDRMETIKVLLNKDAKPEDLAQPGHLFPLKAKHNLLQERQGHTETAIEILQLANLTPIAVIAEIMNKEGDMAKGQELIDFQNKHSLTKISVQEVIQYKNVQ
jgi:3,4-dihydroxy 2-butanone 4-phosphate synthase/GTP cyclohydrolase II|tara:strand:- start:359 stop:958 length:600 start_codon:yes stop_codon:yes gene_type:complete